MRNAKSECVHSLFFCKSSRRDALLVLLEPLEDYGSDPHNVAPVDSLVSRSS